ncbi:unnamed protein product [Coregonus sp. 'balchen']|nr:unnamed protein product [Coregonus sp. 'balchen']
MTYSCDTSLNSKSGVVSSSTTALIKGSVPYWRCYYSNTDAVIYVVDSSDRDRMGISKSELVAMLEEEELKKAILVVFANKQDMEQAMTPAEVANSLGLPALKDRKWQIFKTSATKGTGLDEAMEWLVEALKNRHGKELTGPFKEEDLSDRLTYGAVQFSVERGDDGGEVLRLELVTERQDQLSHLVEGRRETGNQLVWPVGSKQLTKQLRGGQPHPTVRVAQIWRALATFNSPKAVA